MRTKTQGDDLLLVTLGPDFETTFPSTPQAQERNSPRGCPLEGLGLGLRPAILAQHHPLRALPQAPALPGLSMWEPRHPVELHKCLVVPLSWPGWQVGVEGSMVLEMGQRMWAEGTWQAGVSTMLMPVEVKPCLVVLGSRCPR